MEDIYVIIAVCTSLFLAFAFIGCIRDYREFTHQLKKQESCDHKYVLDTQHSLTTWNKDFTKQETSTKAKCFMCGHEIVRRYVEPNKD